MDKFYFPATERQYTEEGYLIVPATISRPGTQVYKASELVPTLDKLPSKFKPNDVVTVYRPPSEVFDECSVSSFKNVAVTNNHPPEFLNSKNHKKYSVGIVLSDVSTTEKNVKATLKITDFETINAVNDGKVDVSAGYNSNIVFEDGETPDGEHYQAVQRDIIGNHVAIVMRGRAGSEVRLADGLDDPSSNTERMTSEGIEQHEGTVAGETREENTHKKSNQEEEEVGADGVPGSNVSNPFGDEEEIVDSIELEQGNKTKEKELPLTLEDAMIKIDELTKANDELSCKVKDQADLDCLVEGRMKLLGVCSKLISDIDHTGKSNNDLKKEVVVRKMPQMEFEGKSQEYIEAIFDMLEASLADVVVEDEVTVEDEDDSDDVDVDDKAIETEDSTEKPEKPADGEKPIETTKNVHEGINKDEGEEKPEEDEPDTETKVEDSVNVLDSAFEIETRVVRPSIELSAYEKACVRSRNAWKKK